MNIKKDDKVIVLSGKDKGKEGKVLVADPKGLKVVVEGVNVATKHQKPQKQGQDGGKGGRRLLLFLRGCVGLRVHDASARGKVDGMAAGPRAPPVLRVSGCAARRARRRMSRHP